MDHLWFVIPIVLTLALIAALALRSRRGESSIVSQVDDAPALVPVVSEVPEAEEFQESQVQVSIALLPEATAIDVAHLSEISDSTVIARISQTIPAMAETATRTAANVALKNMEVYRAILPSGMTLAKSRTMKDAYRGFARRGTASNSPFSANANFVRVDPSKATAVATGVANVMNVGSLVVGQYYMAEINCRLETLTKSVDRIGDFQDREFKSRIVSLIAHVQEISQFSSEILEDESQRNIKLATLDHLRIRATDLLGQVNDTMTGTISDNPDPDRKDYQLQVREIAKLVGYQSALTTVLKEIGDLTYLLGKGSVSADRSYFQHTNYFQQSAKAGAALREWHDRQVQRLAIDLDHERISKSGLEGFFATPLGLIDENLKYRQLEPGIAREIGAQTNHTLESRDNLTDVYDEDVEIIIKGGKFFYLHEAPAGCAEASPATGA